jgi:hypothetical protein
MTGYRPAYWAVDNAVVVTVEMLAVAEISYSESTA